MIPVPMMNDDEGMTLELTADERVWLWCMLNEYTEQVRAAMDSADNANAKRFMAREVDQANIWWHRVRLGRWPGVVE